MTNINSDTYLEIYIDVLESLKAGCKTRSEIYEKLKNKYTFDDITYILNDFLANKEMIIKNDYYYKESKYTLLKERFVKSPYTKHYNNFYDDNPNKKKRILLISDTHIGNKKIANMKLINNIYEYAIKKECEWAFHQGDIFEGNEDSAEEINIFIREYPNYLRTISLLGNHDEKIKNIRQLTKYKDNINFYEISKWATKLNHIDIHFSHRLFLSWLIDDKKINNISDIQDDEKWINKDYDLLISGHLHCGIIYSTQIDDKQILYLGVPSLSNINIGRPCAYIIELNNSDLIIKVLSSDSNYKIYEKENFIWHFKDPNKVLRKSYQ